ncbi:MAG: hypothetical protein CL670_13960 [Balneola sp.]|jgi:hypothetical protein|nr:hypothetical protein [Balneola sp.]MBE80258.1 hypothetical protein [Balneola sp.]HBX66654.1 hypothetical protein [Balneolaceae bacterium]|tara:strand:+ start:62 stop:529 length:468 start_codon:yes stop_codon:yes gene_type:complete
MKSIRVLLFLLIAGASTSIHAQQSKKAVGGYLSGLTAKFTLNEKSAIRTDLGFTLIDVTQINFSANYVIYKSENSLGVESGSLTPYYAPGIRLNYTDLGANVDGDVSYGIEFPIGVEYGFEEAPFEVFIDMGPYLDINPSQIFGFTGSIGFRYQL